MATLAGKAMVKIYADNSELQKGLKRTQRKLKAFAATVRASGMKLMGIGAAMGGGFILSAKAFAEFGDELNKMSSRTGISVEALSELKHAIEQSGGSLKDIETGMRGMARGLVDASNGTGTMKDAMKMLGLSLKDFEGLNPEQQMQKLLDSLEAIEDPTTRAGLAMKAFGRSGTALIPMLGQTKKLREEAQALGITMSTEDAEAAAKLTDAFNMMKSATMAIVRAIGGALAPELTGLATKMAYGLGDMIKWIGKNKGLIVTIAKVAAGIFAAGAALTGIGMALSVAGAAVGGFSTLISVAGTALGLLASPLGLGIALAAGLGYAWVTMSDQGKAAWGELKTDALKAFGGIKDALAAGDITLAAEILWTSLKLVWQKGIQPLKDAWTGFKVMWDETVFALAGVFVDAWHMIEGVFINVVNAISKAWANLMTNVKEGWRSAQDVTTKGLLYIWSTVDDSIDYDEAAGHVDAMAQSRRESSIKAHNESIRKLDEDHAKKVAELEKWKNDIATALESKRAAAEAQNSAEIDATQKKVDDLEAKQDSLVKSAADAKAAAAEATADSDSKAPGGFNIPDISLDAKAAVRKWDVRRMTGISNANIGNLGKLGGVAENKKEIDLLTEQVGLLKELVHGAGLA